MKRLVVIGLVLSTLLFLSGCAKYHTRLFQAHDLSTHIGPYRLVPRVVAYKNNLGADINVDSHEYWTSVKLYDTSIAQPDFGDPAFLAQRDSLAQNFLKRVFSRLSLDSVALMDSNDSTVRASPRLTSQTRTPRYQLRDLNFGQLSLPPAVSDAMLVIYYRERSEAGELSPPLEVRLPLYRVEAHRLTFQDLIDRDSGGFRGNPE
jgi:hypothetical protein